VRIRPKAAGGNRRVYASILTTETIARMTLTDDLAIHGKLPRERRATGSGVSYAIYTTKG